MIIKRRCDVPMAEKKGLFPCNGRCKTCLACIRMNELGQEDHTPTLKGAGDSNIITRNRRKTLCQY